MPDILAISQPSETSYLIYVNLTEFKGEPRLIGEFVSQHRMVASWWNFTPGIYAVRSVESVETLARTMMNFVGKSVDVLVVAIDPKAVFGQLPAGAWEAFYKDIRDKSI